MMTWQAGVVRPRSTAELPQFTPALSSFGEFAERPAASVCAGIRGAQSRA